MSYSPYYGVELAHVATASSSTIKSKASIELVIDDELIQTEFENNNLEALVLEYCRVRAHRVFP